MSAHTLSREDHYRSVIRELCRHLRAVIAMNATYHEKDLIQEKVAVARAEKLLGPVQSFPFNTHSTVPVKPIPIDLIKRMKAHPAMRWEQPE
jgi:hypothetical protein